MSTSEEDDDEFPEEWNKQIEEAPRNVFRRIRRDEKAEVEEIQRMSRKSTIRWIIYTLAFSFLCVALWQNHEVLLRDAREFKTILMDALKSPQSSTPLIIHPKRTIPLQEPLEHYPPPSDMKDFQSIHQSLLYWMKREDRPCMCAHHVVTDGFNHRVCLVQSFDRNDGTIIMWNMRVTGRVVDTEAHVTELEHSQFCPMDEPVERTRPSILYVTWDQNGHVHMNAFYHQVARCLQMAEEEMDASYDCSSSSTSPAL